MLSSVTPAPRLNRLAATLLGMASTSALPPMAIMRSWSGSRHDTKAVSPATPANAWVSAMWISGADTIAGGPDRVMRGSGAATPSAGAASIGAASQARAWRRESVGRGLKKSSCMVVVLHAHRGPVPPRHVPQGRTK